jgi:hypothetical protein
MNEASGEILRKKGYVCFVDILLHIGKLTTEDYESWQSLKLNHMLRSFGQNSIKGGLLASKTAYMSRGKGPRTPLRFSKSGDSNIEEAYSTHYCKPKQTSD